MSKVGRFFAGLRMDGNDPDNAYLRVTSYRRAHVLEAPEGSVELSENHVRFSVWADDRARCVISIPESEARELAAFLGAQLGAPQTA